MPNSPSLTPGCAALPANGWKLWLYTNFDCNLSCTYCLASSTPHAPRRALGLENVQRLVDEAAALGFSEVFFTGGEPFILDEIYAMLAYASQRFKTTVLTNAMLLKGRRLERLQAIQNPNLTVQVSLDGGCAAHHDAYRGAGTWARTVAGIEVLLQKGFKIRLGTTITPANQDHLDEICALHRSWGIPDSEHIVRPLAQRGFSQQGTQVDRTNLDPELTVSQDGVFWHPLSTDADMLIRREIFPLSSAVECLLEQLQTPAERLTFT